MDAFDLINKRKHVRKFDTKKIPDKAIIEECLWKAWKVTPSKQNFMPYKIDVIGPEAKHDEKRETVWSLAKQNKKFVNETNAEQYLGVKNHSEEGLNLNYLYLRTAPYILIISQRVCKPNPYIQKYIVERNDHYEQMHSDYKSITDIKKTAAFEAGLFVSFLWTFVLEHGIDLNCNACFPPSKHDWHGLPILDHPPLMICALGYAKSYRRNKYSEEKFREDLKPEPEEIIKWI